MATEEEVLKVTADIADYKAELAKIPGVTDKAAQKAAEKFVKAQKNAQIRAALEARKASRNAAAAWEKEFRKTATDIGKGLAKGFALAVAAAPAAALALGQNVADLRNQLGDLSDQTGVNTDTLAGLNLALKTSGKDVSNVEASLRGLPKRLADFKRSSGEAKPALEALGFTVDDADQLLGDMDATTKELIRRLQGVKSPGERAALAAQLFGEQGAVINQVLGERTLDDWIASAKTFGDDVGPEAIAAAREWEATMAILSGTFAKTKGQIADTLNLTKQLQSFALGFVFLKEVAVGALEEISNRMAIGGRIIKAVADRDFGALQSATAEIVEVTKGAWLPVTDEVIEKAAKASFEFFKESKAITEAAKSTKEQGRELQRTTEQQKKATDEAKRAADQAAKAAAATQSIGDIRLRSLEDVTSQEQLLRLEVLRQLDAIDELEKTSKDAAQAESARNAVLARERRDLIVIQQERKLELVELADQLDEIHLQILQQLEEEKQRRAENFAFALDQATMLASASLGFASELTAAQLQGIEELAARQSGAIADMRSQRKALAEEAKGDISEQRRAEIEASRATLKEDLDARKKRLNQSRQDARKAFKASQGLGIADVGINQAAAVMKAFALLGPPPSPAGLASAAAAVLQGATQISAINRQKPPQFQIGGFTPFTPFPEFTVGPDEVLTRTSAGEATLTRRATENIPDEAIERANATGDTSGMGGGGTTFVNVFEGREISRVVAREAERRGPEAFGMRGGPVGVQDVFGAG